MAGPPGSAPTQGPPGGGNFLFILVAVMVVMMLWTLLVSNPKRKAEERKREEALNTLTKGDKVVTTAGIHGTVESVEKERGVVNVTVAPKIVMTFSRSAIAACTKKDKDADAAA